MQVYVDQRDPSRTAHVRSRSGHGVVLDLEHSADFRVRASSSAYAWRLPKELRVHACHLNFAAEGRSFLSTHKSLNYTRGLTGGLS